MKTRPLWALLSGPPSITLVRDDEPMLGAKPAKITFPIGARSITFDATREAADAIQRALTLEIIPEDWHG